MQSFPSRYRVPLFLLTLVSVLLVTSGCAGWFGVRVSSSPTANLNIATFTESHLDAYRDRVTIVVPEVYELMQVAIALTSTSQEHPYRYTDPDTAYYQAVMDHFAPYRDHALIEALDDALSGPTAYRATFAYHFDGDELVEGGQYSVTGLNRAFEGLLPEMEAFARESGFRAFYADHADFYQAQVDTYRRVVDPAHIWQWMEANFPARYDAYTIVLSPLMNGTNNTWRFRDREAGYEEIVMFAPSPNVFAPDVEDPDVNISQEVADVILARAVFTEIDHNYVNPVTDEHLKAIDRAMRPLEAWNEGAGSYGSPALTFNEYFTWAIFGLYAETRYEPSLAAAAWDRTRAMMDWRGFPRFDAFYEELHNAYSERRTDETVADLLPEMIAWMQDVD